MKKRITKITAAAAAFIMVLSGCNSEKPAETTAAAGTGTEAAAQESSGSSVSRPTEMEYKEASGGFTGNTGEVKLEPGDTYAVISIEKFGDIKIKLFPEAAPYGVKNFIDLANSGFYAGKNVHRVISGFMFQGGSQNGNGTGGEAAEGGEFSCEINSAMRHFYGALCYANAGGRNTCQFYIVNNKEPQPGIGDYYNNMYEQYKQYETMFTEAMNGSEKGSNEYMYYAYNLESIRSSLKGLEFMKDKDKDGSVEKKYAEVGGTPSLDGGYTVFGQTVEGFDVIDAVSAVKVSDNGNGETSSPVEEILISSVTIHTA